MLGEIFWFKEFCRIVGCNLINSCISNHIFYVAEKLSARFFAQSQSFNGFQHNLLDDEDTNKVLDIINNLLTTKKYEGVGNSPIEYIVK